MKKVIYILIGAFILSTGSIAKEIQAGGEGPIEEMEDITEVKPLLNMDLSEEIPKGDSFLMAFGMHDKPVGGESTVGGNGGKGTIGNTTGGSNSNLLVKPPFTPYYYYPNLAK